VFPKKWSDTIVWFIIHIAFPMFPILVAGFIRFGVTQNFNRNTFNASEIAISMALLTLFVSQSLMGSEMLLDNENKKNDVEAAAKMLIMGTVTFIGLFVIMVFIDTMDTTVDNNEKLDIFKSTMIFFENTTFILTIPSLVFSILIQRSFRLKAQSL
jgi:hypothetical protein